MCELPSDRMAFGVTSAILVASFPNLPERDTHGSVVHLDQQLPACVLIANGLWCPLSLAVLCPIRFAVHLFPTSLAPGHARRAPDRRSSAPARASTWSPRHSPPASPGSVSQSPLSEVNSRCQRPTSCPLLHWCCCVRRLLDGVLPCAPFARSSAQSELLTDADAFAGLLVFRCTS